MSDGIVELKVNGAIFGGWQKAEIRSSIEQISGTFSVTITDRWPGVDLPAPALQGYPVEILLDGQVVISGYIDDLEPEYDENSHTIHIEGRDKTEDLVDCSAIHASGQWNGRTLTQIATDVCAPFGIKVIAQVDVGAPFPTLNIQEGERAFETLDRAARMRAVLLTSDGLGNLIITRAGQTRAGVDLVEGVNIKHAKGKFSWKERFSHYIVKGQYRNSDGGDPALASGPSGTADDTYIDRYRPIVILAEDQGHVATLGQRAAWEKHVRIGRSGRATITVQGWKNDVGLWTKNTIVRLRSPKLYADLDLLIVSVTYHLGESGTTAELEVCRPEAFDLLAGVQATRLNRQISIKSRQGAAMRVRGDNQRWLQANAGSDYQSNISTVTQGEVWN